MNINDNSYNMRDLPPIEKRERRPFPYMLVRATANPYGRLRRWPSCPKHRLRPPPFRADLSPGNARLPRSGDANAADNELALRTRFSIRNSRRSTRRGHSGTTVRSGENGWKPRRVAEAHSMISDVASIAGQKPFSISRRQALLSTLTATAGFAAGPAAVGADPATPPSDA